MKKGIYFLVTALLFLIVFATINFIITVSDDLDVEETINLRVQLMNDFLSDFENDAPRAMFVSSFRAFIALEENIFLSGEFYSNIEQSFTEVFVNGTINGTAMDIMVDSSLTDYITKVNTISNKLGMNLEFELTNVTINQSSAWELFVTLEGTVNLSDNSGLASWYYNTSIQTYVPIDNLRDPVYTVKTQGKLPSPIIRWNTSNVLVNNSDTDNLKDFVNETFYIENPAAPSFLMRFSNNLGSSPYGIESVVNLKRLGTEGIPIQENVSVVDWIYFNPSANYTYYCDVENMMLSPNWFVIDDDHYSLWGMQNLSKITCS